MLPPQRKIRVLVVDDSAVARAFLTKGLSAYPHLEGAYHFGEGVLPLLEQRGVWTNPAPVGARASVPFGGQRAAS